MSAATTSDAVGALQSRIVGNWDLKSFALTVNSHMIHPMGDQPKGIHIFTTSGHMSANILNPGQPAYASPNPFAAADEEYAESGRRFMAWAGKWSVTPLGKGDGSEAGVLAYEIHVVNFPNQLGRTQERKVWMEDEGSVLVITSLDDHGPFMEYRWTRLS